MPAPPRTRPTPAQRVGVDLQRMRVGVVVEGGSRAVEVEACGAGPRTRTAPDWPARPPRSAGRGRTATGRLQPTPVPSSRGRSRADGCRSRACVVRVRRVRRSTRSSPRPRRALTPRQVGVGMAGGDRSAAGDEPPNTCGNGSGDGRALRSPPAHGFRRSSPARRTPTTCARRSGNSSPRS